MVDGAAAANRLPAAFLARILWQESRLRSEAISPAGAEGVWTRIAAVKQRAPASTAEPKAFAYDENEPLQLIADVKPRRR